LAHNLLALSELLLGIAVVRVELDALPEVLDGIFGPQDGGIGCRAAIVSLEECCGGLVSLGEG